MATHDEATLDRALEMFARVKRDFEAEHGPLPGRTRWLATAARPSGPRPRAATCPFLHKSFGRQKSSLLATNARARLTGAPSLA